jgi:hypothetical protein
MYNKSRSFKEFENKINEYYTFENDWGFYIDTDSNKILKNITNTNTNTNINHHNNNNNFCSKYSTIISIVLFSVIIVIII